MQPLNRFRSLSIACGLALGTFVYVIGVWHAGCGMLGCTEGVLSQLNFVLLWFALPFMLGYTVALLTLAAIAVKLLEKRKR